MDELIGEFDRKLLKEKQSIETEFQEKIKNLLDQVDFTYY